MTLVLKKNNQNSASDLFPLILLKDLLKYCNDYGTLKTIQQSTTTLNDLFTCPSQLIWKQLCARKRYHYLLKREARCLLKRSSLIWETIYYQNWKLDRNWMNKRYEISDLGKKIGLNKNLTRMINGRASIGLSIPIDFENENISLWDFKRGLLLSSELLKGQVTSSCLQGNYLVLGKSCGSMTIIKMFTSEKWTRTVKHHSKEISAIAIDLKDESIVSGDVCGQVIVCKIDGDPIVLYQHPSHSGITALLLQPDCYLATTIDGYLLEFKSKRSTKSFCFTELGSINCIAESNESVLMGTDSGKLIVAKRRRGFSFEETGNTSPIISIAADAKKVVTGHFDGSITAFSIKLDGSLRKLFTENGVNRGAVWSIGIDEQTLLSCSLNGEVILRRFT